MLDIKRIKDDPEAVKAGLRAKEVDCDAAVDRILELDAQRRALILSTETDKAEQNRVSKEIPKRKKAGEDVAPIFARMAELKAQIAQNDQKLTDVEARLLESEKSAVLVALAGTAAHELNQPLTSVMGYAELLKRRMPPEDPDLRAVEVIYREAERMADIVRKIGRITRFETKAYVGGAQIVDLERSMSHDE